MKICAAILIAFIFCADIGCAQRLDYTYRPVIFTPPPIAREFRGAWMTCVASNADWPSQPGLPVAQQKAQLISLLDRAAQLHLNAVIFQVRPASDAMYASSIEPWSEYLTGTQGKPPQPFYDPLAFAIEEAHKRGLELHAWFNPFRARHPLSKSAPAPNQVIRTHPEWIRKYGDQTWLDPGEPAVRAYVLRVVMDVVNRYNVDGVQFDDYFYPYPEKNAEGRVMDFPDLATWKKYGLPLHETIGDWRRANVDDFIYNAYQEIKAAKPWVKFGVSPFGIWRPGFPASVRGLDAYATLYADSRMWFSRGWLDYFAPQLYWPIDAPQQSFPALLNWWAQQNDKGRDLWPGLNAAGVGEKFSANEIARQIQIIRAQPRVSGEIFFHLKSLLNNGELNDLIRRENPQVALPPAMPWLHSAPPATPELSATNARGVVTLRWQAAANEILKWWVLQYRGTNDIWTTRIFPASETGCKFSTWQPDIVAVSAVDRYGNISAPAVIRKILTPARGGKGRARIELQ